MNEQVRSILICPHCQGHRLAQADESFACRDCGRTYPIIDGIPVFLPEELDDFKKGEADYHSEGVSNFDDVHRLDMLRNSHYHDEALRPILDLPKGALVLELAGGVGHDAETLMAGGQNIVETDIALECVRETRRRTQRESLPPPGQHATYMVVDAETLPFAPGSFDAVYTCAAWHHLPDPIAGLRQMTRCVKQDGLVVLSMEPNAWPYHVFYPSILPLWWKVAALGRLVAEPRQFIQTSRLIQPLRAKLDGNGTRELAGEPARGESPGDETTRGFSKPMIMEHLKAADLDLVRLQRVFYLNGLIQETPRLCQIQLRARLERRLITIDETLARVPLVKHLNWFWNIVAQPKPRGCRRRSASRSANTGEGSMTC